MADPIFPFDEEEYNRFYNIYQEYIPNAISMMDYMEYGWIPIKEYKRVETKSLKYNFYPLFGYEKKKDGLLFSDVLYIIAEILRTDYANVNQYLLQLNNIRNGDILSDLMRFINNNLAHNYVVVENSIVQYVRFIERPLDYALIKEDEKIRLKWRRKVREKENYLWCVDPILNNVNCPRLATYKSRTGMTLNNLDEFGQIPSIALLFAGNLMTTINKRTWDSDGSSSLYELAKKALKVEEFYEIENPAGGLCGYHVIQQKLGIPVVSALTAFGIRVDEWDKKIYPNYQTYLNEVVAKNFNQKDQLDVGMLIAILMMHSTYNFGVISRFHDTVVDNVSDEVIRYKIGPMLYKDKDVDFLILFDIKGYFNDHDEFEQDRNANNSHFTILQKTLLPKVEYNTEWIYPASSIRLYKNPNKFTDTGDKMMGFMKCNSIYKD